MCWTQAQYCAQDGCAGEVLPGQKDRVATDDAPQKRMRKDSLPPEDVPSEHDAIKVEHLGDNFIDGLGIVLNCWVQKAERPTKLSRFHSARAPAISIQDYLKRLRKFFRCSDECFLLALVYLDRISKTNTSMAVCDVTIHRLLVTALMIATKLHDDLYYSNAHYGKAGGLSLKEANLLESVMLKELNWKLWVSSEEHDMYHSLVWHAFN